jgi:hypothetical protein
MSKLTRQLGFIRRLLPLTAVLLLAASPSCGSSSGRKAAPALPAANPAAPGQSDSGTTESTPRNVLSTHMPTLAGLTAGAEFDFTVSANCAEALYQGSGRVLYDPTVMEPITAERGTALPGACLFVAKLDAALVATPGLAGLPANSGMVPYAFTLLPQTPGTSIARGELFRIRFRLRQPSSSSTVQLLNNAAYLQLRDAQGARLAFSLDSEVGP